MRPRNTAVFAILLASSAIAQGPAPIPAGAKVYIEDASGSSVNLNAAPKESDPKIYADAAHGFDFYLVAALQAKHVPLTVVTDRSMADYALEGTWDHVKSFGLKPSIFLNWEAPIIGQRVTDHDSASFRLVNLSTNEIVFAYSVDRNNTHHGCQTMAESIAKHLGLAVTPNRQSLAKAIFSNQSPALNFR